MPERTDPPAQPARAPLPHWTTYVDLVAKILLPVAVLGATILYNRADTASKKLQSDRADCYNHQFEFAKLIKEKDHEDLDGLWADISADCKAAGKQPYRRTAEQVISSTKNVDVRAQAVQQLGLPVSRTILTVNPATAPPPIVDSGRAPTLRPRVYIQIHDSGQRQEAEKLRALLGVSELAGQTISAPGVDLPANPRARVTRTELRCAGQDCVKAPELAAYIAARLGRPSIPVRDITALYGTAGSRPGHYELWIGPEPLTVAAGT